MSIVGIFTQSRPQIGGIYFDATLSESTELTTDITEFPIDSGAIGNDHAVQRPMVLTMRVGISNNPSRAARGVAGDVGGATAGNLAGTAIGGAISQLNGEAAAVTGVLAVGVNAAVLAGQSTTRAQSALDAVRNLQRTNAIFNVVTSSREYPNCMIANTRQETNKENEQALELVIELRQLIVIPLQSTAEVLPQSSDPASTQGQKLQDLGLVG